MSYIQLFLLGWKYYEHMACSSDDMRTIHIIYTSYTASLMAVTLGQLDYDKYVICISAVIPSSHPYSRGIGVICNASAYLRQILLPCRPQVILAALDPIALSWQDRGLQQAPFMNIQLGVMSTSIPRHWRIYCICLY